MSLTALLVDDEAPARARLRQLLGERADVTIVGEAEDGVQAIERIQALAPDVVFLDIQMPGCGGLEVVASLGQPRPAVVFCTAFDQHAVDAFELQAVDYLLKPVTRARLDAALARIVQPTTSTEAATSSAPESGGDETVDTPLPGGPPTRFLARRGARYLVVPLADVVAFSFDDGQTRLHTAAEQLLMQPTLAQLQRRLDPARFFQISRSVVVHLEAVREAKPHTDGTGQLVLSNGTTVEVSRRRWRPLLDQLEG
ncbi:MAG: response regulator transcription factor [Acidobacteria bacterium]|nr:response regulator transcription factor [Acidobacteriota bacterium]